LIVDGKSIVSDAFFTLLSGSDAGLLVRGQEVSVDGAVVGRASAGEPVQVWQPSD
jgi:hypothetical protein